MLVMTSCVSSKSEQNKTEPRQLSVSVLTNLQRGISLTQLTEITGIKPQHQFTVQDGTSAVTCIKLAFVKPRGFLYFIFQDDKLFAIKERPAVEFETKTHNGKPWQVPKPVDAEVRMTKVKQGRDLTPADIKRQLEQWAKNEAVASKGKEPLNILPAFIITSPLMLVKSPAIAHANSKADDLSERFDAIKIQLGFSPEKTQEVFGDPVRRISAGTNGVVCVYGSDLPPDASVHNPAVWVSVVYREGKAVRVFSHDFFDKSLLTGKRTD